MTSLCGNKFYSFLFSLSKVAPANTERQTQLNNDKALMSKLTPYRRKLLRTQRQMVSCHTVYILSVFN